MTQQFDPFLLFAEQHGVYLTPRQLVFCHAILSNKSSVQAYKDAGIPEEEGTAEAMYDSFSKVIEDWRTAQELDYKKCLQVYRDAQDATTDKKVTRNDAAKTVDVIQVPVHATRMQGSKGLCEMLGFKAPDKSEVTVTPGALPDDIKELLKSVRDQAASK